MLEQILDWQTHCRKKKKVWQRNTTVSRHTHTWISVGWMAEQHVQGVKRPITVNQASAASQGGKERKLYPGSGPPELACRVQRGGKSTGCHIHLDFYECFDSSPEDTPMTRWRVFTQACQTSKDKKKMRWRDICRSPLLSERKKKNYSNCNWK